MTFWLTLLLLLPQTTDDATRAEPKVVATVAETTITKSAVDFLITQRVKGIFAGQANSSTTFDVALQHLIDQAIVLNYLESRPGVTPSDVSVDVAAEITKVEKQLARSDQTLDQWLGQQKRHRQDLEFEIRWRLRWSDYTNNLLSDAKQREKAFQRWGFRFDGSQVEVAQIFLKVDPQSRPAQLKLANEIHARLTDTETVSDKIWNEEVLAHSQSPNRSNQEHPGYVGKIEYAYPMPKRFSESAFSLKPGAISVPIETGLGIHIVRMLKRQPSTRTIDQCKDDLDRTMKREAFHAILDRHRKKVVVGQP